MGVAMGGRGPSGQCWALRGHWTLMSSLGGVQTGLLSYSDSGTQDRQLISLPLPHVHLIPSKAIDSLRAGPWLSPPAFPHHLAPDIPRKNLSVDPRDDQGHTDSPGAVTEPLSLGFLVIKWEITLEYYIDATMPHPQECHKGLSIGVP